MATKKATTTRKKAPAKKSPAKKPAAAKYVRNLTGYDVRIRLGPDQDGETLKLKGRGQRGDTSRISRPALQDSILQENVALGVIELITEAEAKKVIEGQVTNQQQATHPALAALRNELGEEYGKDAVTTTPSNEQQATVVAKLDGEGNLASEGKAGIDWDAAREGALSKFVDAPAEPEGVFKASAPAQDPAEAADAAARQKGAEGPAAGLGGIERVTVAPPQKADK